MILVGCDLHTRKQQVALLNTDPGELRDQELSHVGADVERCYAALSPPVTVGIESTGYSLWFHALLQRLGHTLLVGEAAKIRARVVRKTKTDRRDARHLRDRLKDNRFPVGGFRIPRRATGARSSHVGSASSASGRWSKTACTRSP